MKTKLTSIFLLIVSFLFSCKSDDDGGPQFQEGWTQELVNLAAKECENDNSFSEEETGIELEIDCLCSVQEVAKLFPFSRVVNDDLTDIEKERLGLAVIKNCSK